MYRWVIAVMSLIIHQPSLRIWAGRVIKTIVRFGRGWNPSAVKYIHISISVADNLRRRHLRTDPPSWRARAAIRLVLRCKPIHLGCTISVAPQVINTRAG